VQIISMRMLFLVAVVTSAKAGVQGKRHRLWALDSCFPQE